jgi:phage protein U
MLMALGQFVFGLTTLAYQDFKRQTQWRHPSSSRVGARAAHQYAGPGDDTITLSGVLSPELVGRAASIAELRAMGDTGQAWALVSGTGEVFGAYVIESVSETGTLHLDNGIARRIEFDLQLKRVDDQRSGAAVNVGALGDFQAGGA